MFGSGFANTDRELFVFGLVRVRSVLREPAGPVFANTPVRELFVPLRYLRTARA